jgi:hypothetical protein
MMVTVKLLIYTGRKDWVESEHLHPKVATAVLQRLVLAQEGGGNAVKHLLVKHLLEQLKRGKLPNVGEPTN